MRLTSPGGDGAIVAGGNTAAVLAALADAADETENPLFVAAGLQGFNGATLDMLRSEGTDRDAIAEATLGRLETLVYGLIFNGTSFDRQRGLGGTALDGRGQASVSAAVPGASVVTTIRDAVGSTATTRKTIATPTAGTRIRILSVRSFTATASGAQIEVYFGTGANSGTNPASAITDNWLDLDFWPQAFDHWGDGSGPVGAVDEVLSIRANGGIGANARVVVHYREE